MAKMMSIPICPEMNRLQFQIHSIVNFIVFQSNMILVNVVPFLQNNLFCLGAGLGGDQLFQVTNGVIRAS
jgi:hypothetical protein